MSPEDRARLSVWADTVNDDPEGEGLGPPDRPGPDRGHPMSTDATDRALQAIRATIAAAHSE